MRAFSHAILKLLAVLYIARKEKPDGSTYRGVAHRLGYISKSALRENARQAEELGLVRRVSAGKGPGAVVVLQLTEQGIALMERAGGSHAEKEK